MTTDQLNTSADADTAAPTGETPAGDPADTAATETVATVPAPIEALVARLNRILDAMPNGTKWAAQNAAIVDRVTIDLEIANALAWVRSAKPGKTPDMHENTCHFWPLNQPAEPMELALQAQRDLFAGLPDGLAGKDKMLEIALADVSARYACDCALSRKGKGGNRANPDNPGPKNVLLRHPDGRAEVSVDTMAHAIENHLIVWFPDSERLQKHHEYYAAKKAANARVYIEGAIEKKQIPADVVFNPDGTPFFTVAG